MRYAVDEALKEIELQKILLESLGIVSKQLTDNKDISFLIERINTCFMPSDFIITCQFKYENQAIGSSKLYVHDTGDCFIVVDIEKNLPTEVIKQLLLLGYKPECTGWLTYKRRVY